ncbi:hypothetical protein M0802_011118 [Mischocyttarus mexicanus]|nr:hypothetical protein M0802_011118 [Mischocyttarus mexicanus]
MRLPILLLFLLTYQISNSDGSYNEENTAFRGDLTRAKFGEGVRDWFRNLRDRLLGRKPSINYPENKEMINPSNAEIQDRVRDAGGFFVDLSRVNFDPKYDIGFRIGHWYFIRMGDKFDDEFVYNDSKEWGMSSFVPDQITHQLSDNDWSNDDDDDDNDDDDNTTLSSSIATNTVLMEDTTMETDAIESTITESSITETSLVQVEDNETKSTGNSASVEVIFP